MRKLTILLTLSAFACTFAADKKMALKDVPPAVQKTIEANLNGAEIKNINKEVEKGAVQYEVETMLNGKHRDFDVSAKGTLLVVEEEIAVDSIPPAAKATIMKKVGAGKLGMVETFTRPGGETMYEASFTSKAGKKAEVLVKADGTEAKE